MSKRRKKNELRTPNEAMFLGDSRDLKYYLVSKNKALKKILKERKGEFSKQQLDKISAYEEMIEYMLEQRVFNGRKTYQIPDLIDEIKLERADLQSAINALKEATEKAKKVAEEAFSRENKYLANAYEELYNTEGQQELRELIAEYEVCKVELEGYQKDWKALWWILGVIHRPIGFFSKILDDDVKT